MTLMTSSKRLSKNTAYSRKMQPNQGEIACSSSINQYFRIMEKITFNQLKEDYFNNDVCMAEVLASTPATGLTIEQAFYLYIRAKNWSDKDEFELYSEGDYYDLVEEAKNMEL